MKMKFEVIDSIWFKKIGIVKVKTKYRGIQYSIGVSKDTERAENEQRIARLGESISPKQLMDFFKNNQ
jgi:hypothetical protein